MSEKIKAYEVDLTELKPDPGNANAGSERGQYMLEASVGETGLHRGVAVDANGYLVAGNKTHQAAVDAGFKRAIVVETDGDTLVVTKRRDFDLMDDDPNNKARRAAYFDNRSSEVSLNWDAEQLLADINAGMDLSALFRDDELDVLLADLQEDEHVSDPGPQVDRADELGQKWGTATGQIWQIAQHFVICGDCREPETWHRLFDAAGVDKVNGVFTSPPYAEQRKEQYGGIPAGEYVDWWEAVQANVKANLASDGSFFVNIKPHCEDGQRVLYVMDLVCAMVRRWGWKYVDELCWYSEGLPGHWPNRFRNSFEPIYHYAVSKDMKFYPKAVGHFSSSIRDGTGGLDKTNGGNYTINTPTKSGIAQPGNVLTFHSAANANHAAAFPVDLPDFFVRAYSDDGDVWCDPFLGSGTAIVAAHQNDRTGLGIEMLPKYLGVILERLQEVTGKTPVLVT